MQNDALSDCPVVAAYLLLPPSNHIDYITFSFRMELNNSQQMIARCDVGRSAVRMGPPVMNNKFRAMIDE